MSERETQPQRASWRVNICKAYLYTSSKEGKHARSVYNKALLGIEVVFDCLLVLMG